MKAGCPPQWSIRFLWVGFAVVSKAAGRSSEASWFGIPPNQMPYSATVIRKWLPLLCVLAVAGCSSAASTTPTAISSAAHGVPEVAYVLGTNRTQTDSSIVPINMASGTAGTAVSLGYNASDFAVTANGQTAVAVIPGSGLEIVSLTTGDIENRVTIPDVALRVALDNDTGFAYVLSLDVNATTGTRGPSDGQLTPVTIATGVTGTPIPIGSGTGLVLVPSQALAVILGDGLLTPVDLTTARAGTPIPAVAGSVMALAPDDRTLYVLKLPEAGSTELLPFSLPGLSRETPIRVPGAPTAFVVDHSGRGAWLLNTPTTGSQMPVLEHIDFSADHVDATIPVPYKSFGVSLTPDGAVAVVEGPTTTTLVRLSGPAYGCSLDVGGYSPPAAQFVPAGVTNSASETFPTCPSPTPTPVAAAVGSAQASGLGVPAAMIDATDNLLFSPSSIRIHVNGVVRWVNTSQEGHTVTFDNYPTITDPSFLVGATWEVKFTQPGVYNYECLIHPGMDGTVTVVRP